MVYLLVRHSVADWEKWKPAYDDSNEFRKEAGSLGSQVFTDADNPNMVTVLLKWDSLENAQKFTSSDELKQKMMEAGVTSQPAIHFLDLKDELEM